MSVHQAMLVAERGPTTLYRNGASEPNDSALAELQRRGVATEQAPLTALNGEGLQLYAIELADARAPRVDAQIEDRSSWRRLMVAVERRSSQTNRRRSIPA